MYFVELQKRLIEAARQRIRTGLVTERRLARLCDISQPHMHNVLHGVRSITFDSADKILRGLQFTVPDLISHTEETPGNPAPEARNVHLLRARVGPGRQASFSIFDGHLSVPAEIVKGAIEPVLARLAPDLALPHAFMAGDLVLLDQNPAPRSGYWVIADGGMRVCRLRFDKNLVWIANEGTAGPNRAGDSDEWRPLDTRGRPIEELLKARIIWMARDYGASDQTRS